MKHTFRIIFYFSLHIMLALTMAIKDRNDSIMAFCIAFVCFVLFMLIRPSFTEWVESCGRRIWFYYFGAAFFGLVSLSGRLKTVGDWEDIVSFTWWLRFLTCLLLIKAFIGVYANNKIRYKKKLLDMHKTTLEKRD